MADATIDGGTFRNVLGHFPTGVTVVTAADGDTLVGMAIGSFASVSLDPPLVMFCPGKSSGSWAGIENAGHFCVNILGDDQGDVCGVFASKSDDKFAGVKTRTEATGAPVIEGCIGWIDCTVDTVHDGGDHWIVVGRVQALDVGEPNGPLLFFKGGYGSFTELDG